MLVLPWLYPKLRFKVFIFGIKPKSPSSEYGYFITKKGKLNINKVTKFIEKPNIAKAKQVIKKKRYWNKNCKNFVQSKSKNSKEIIN